MSSDDTPSNPERPRARPRLRRSVPGVDPAAAVIRTNHTGKQRDFTAPPKEFVCEGCDATKPSADFTRYLEALGLHRGASGADPSLPEPDRLCNHCATYGPPLENPLAALSKPEIDALAVLAAGGSMRRAAIVMGVSERQIRAYLSGREKAMLRGAYQKLLLQMGITPQVVAQVLLDALGAEKPVSLGHGEIQMFPDHSTRLKAALAAQKILQLEQPGELTARAPETGGAGFHLHTNLGDGAVVEDGAYTVEIRPAPRTVN